MGTLPLRGGENAEQTLQPEDRDGRLFAAYAGVFLIGALL
jgi:drug/metabolite transporter superfamily protein YnfA